MFRIMLLSAVILAATLSPARAGLIYDFTWSGSFGITASWSFATPAFLSTTTTIPAASLLTGFSNDGTIASVEIGDPFGVSPRIGTSLTGGSFGGFADSGFGGSAPFDHVGSYTSLAGSVLLITESPEVPEPSSFLLVATGVLLAACKVRRRMSRVGG